MSSPYKNSIHHQGPTGHGSIWGGIPVPLSPRTLRQKEGPFGHTRILEVNTSRMAKMGILESNYLENNKGPPKKKSFLMEKLGDHLLLEDVYSSFL